jgi:hypothetical protein
MQYVLLIRVKSQLAVIVIILLLAGIGCQVISGATPPPPPGWYDNASDLLLDETAFPDGWRTEPNEAYPRANNVAQVFYSPRGSLVDQIIWRAYNLDDAEEKYAELRESQFRPHLLPEEMIADWLPPFEIDFRSTTADEFYLACAWEEWASCQLLARYSNYVVLMRFPREAEFEGQHSQGMTYEEIEPVIEVMDAKFTEYLNSLPAPSS